MNEAETMSPQHNALTTLRHLVLAAMASFIHPFWLIGLKAGFEKSVEIFIGSIVIAAVITGLAYLFFTNGTGKDWRGNFYRSMWVMLALILVGNWTT